MSADYTIRRATVDDVAIVTHQRVGMFIDMGIDAARTQAMAAPFTDWLNERFNNGTYLGWLAVADEQVVAGAGLWLYEWIPSPLAPDTTRGYILNVYTERDYRKQGIARALVETILAYCVEHKIRVALLHASKEGRPIYTALGFVQTNEMRKDL
ncbi:MAG TPA: GNAT family N-acetyltransferase [Phototrophicaceae bacterium]|nr:GNAT family N-acetyltransferase [Phototrophicaceae bacterium]